MAAASKDTFYLAVPGVKVQQVRIDYLPAPLMSPHESSRYTVSVNGVIFGQVRRSKHYSREWGAESLHTMDGGSLNPHQIPAMFPRRREVAIRMIEQVLTANTQLIAPVGLA